ncbi:MAG: hypothetical protein NVSMB6_17000 [Burkholderiaceae bacterium]
MMRVRDAFHNQLVPLLNLASKLTGAGWAGVDLNKRRAANAAAKTPVRPALERCSRRADASGATNRGFTKGLPPVSAGTDASGIAVVWETDW